MDDKSNPVNTKKAKFHLKDNESFELLFAGDTSFGENYQEKIKEKGGENILERFGYDYPFEKLKSIMVNADFVVVNLETPITNLKHSPFEDIKDYIHWTDIENAPETLLKHNVSLISIANNHSFDYGKEGFAQTLKVLGQYQLPVIGAGENIEQAGEPFIGEVEYQNNRFTFAIISAFEDLPYYRKKYKVYADDDKPGLMPLNRDSISKQIQKIKKSNPDIFVIIFPHWGDNYAWRDAEQHKIGEELIRSGADLIIGHGSHTVQEIDKFNQKWIINSIGNFMFNSPGRYKKQEAAPYSAVAALNVNLINYQLNISLKLYPIVSDNKITNYQPRFLNEKEFNDFYEIIDHKMNIEGRKLSNLERQHDQYGHYLILPVIPMQIESSIAQVKWIGMIFHEREDKNESRIYPYMYRAFVIDRELVKHGYKLICYTPREVDKSKKTVKGYILEDGQFRMTSMSIPKVNYDFHIGSAEITPKQRNEYREFEPWAVKHGYEIYPPKSIRNLAGDKLLTAEILKEFDSSIVPKTESFKATLGQLEDFLRGDHWAFIKPRRGKMGNDIFVIKQEDKHHLIEYYFKGKKKSKSIKTLAECFPFINENAKVEEYIIQTAIDSITFEDSVVDIRTIIFNVGEYQHYISELVVGKKGNEVSNLYQKGLNYSVEDFLPKVFSKERAPVIIKKITDVSKNIAKFLNSRYQEKINEIAFDILIDKDENIYIAELNVKPGLAGEPMEYSDFYNMTNDEKQLYETLTVKHGEYLALSLLKLCGVKTKDNIQYWFNDITTSIDIDERNARKLVDLIFNAIDKNVSNIAQLPDDFPFDDTPRLIFLTISDNHSRAKVYLGSGKGLLNAVNAALALCKESGPRFNLQSLKVDIVQQIKVIENHLVNQPLKFDRSLYGIAFNDKIRLGFLPEQLVTSTFVNGSQHLLPNKIIKKSQLTPVQIKYLKNRKSYKLYPFTTQSFYWSSTNFSTLYRGHRLFNKIDADLLLSSAISAGKYLQQAVKEDGSFIYEYLPKMDEVSDKYNVLRHAGSVYAMLELYELTKDEALFKAAEKALINLLDRAKVMHVKGDDFLCILEKGFIKLGANALTLLALSKFITITQDTSCLEIGRRLAKWMKTAQNSEGAFFIHKQKHSTKNVEKFISRYYPGEAIFSLVRFYEVDPNPLWLDMAQNAANYIINVRDKNRKIAQLDHDHWLLYGLNELFRQRPDPIYISHTQKICESIINAQYTKLDPPDYVGSFYAPPRSTPVATRAEGLCAAYHLLSDNQIDEGRNNILEAIKLCIRFQLQTQYQPERTLYFKNPQTALGGFSSSLTDYSIRIDYVQHNLSSIIGLYKILKSNT